MWFSRRADGPARPPGLELRMAAAALLSQLSKPPTVVRMQGELGADAAAGAYEALLRERMGSDPRFDLILLGVGPDSHTASLFPGKPELEELGRFAAPVPLAGMEPQVPRVTLTFPVLNGAREVDFLVSGADKADAVARAFTEPPDPEAPAGARPPAGGLAVRLPRRGRGGAVVDGRPVHRPRRRGHEDRVRDARGRQAHDARAGQDRRVGLRRARRPARRADRPPARRGHRRGRASACPRSSSSRPGGSPTASTSRSPTCRCASCSPRRPGSRSTSRTTRRARRSPRRSTRRASSCARTS